MSRVTIATRHFEEGFNCSQSVFVSFVENHSIANNLALKLASGFGGGMGRKQEVCGAVTGAILVIGLLYGRGESDEKEKQNYTYEKVRDFLTRFEADHGTIICRNLLDGCDLLSPEGREYYRANDLRKQCLGYVETAVKILEELTY